MPAEPPPAEPPPAEPPPAEPAETEPIQTESAADGPARRRRLAEVFGEVLPEATVDDRPDRGSGGGDLDERWYRENRPPHHGG
jgi:hypothetical protein